MDELLAHYAAAGYTAQEIAESLHTRGREVAKVVVIKHADKLGLAVLPAHARVDLERLEAALGDQVTLATEDEFAAAFALPGLAREVEWLEAVSVPERFGAVGMHYDTFESVSDQELIRVLASPAVSRPG